MLINPKAPQLNPFPGKRSVVLMDNCSIHHDEEVRELIEDQCGKICDFGDIMQLLTLVQGHV